MNDKISDLQVGIAGEHLVCADLITMGHRAFLSDQGLPYDIVAEIDDKLYRIQVKTTSKFRAIPQRKKYTPAYLFWIKRCGKGGKKTYTEKDFDFMALVALDKKIVGYIERDQAKSTMHINEQKLKALTFEKLWK